MISHYLRVAFRNAASRKSYSIINIAGLAVGMACCILILVFILTEIGYDRYHVGADNIYRLGANLTLGGTPNAIASTNATPALAMVEEYPEVLGAARVRPMGKRPVKYEDRQIYEERILWADASIFEVFSFPMVRGNPASALDTAFTMVITEETAERYFGDRDPLGEALVIGDEEYTINGVIENVRSDSHFVFDMLCSMETLYDRNRELMESWASPFIHYSYVVLHETADYRALEKKFPEMIDKYMGEGLAAAGVKLEYFLQPLTRIHLHSDLRHELAANSDVSYVYIFGTVALSILLIACFNFMNLATARSSARAREIGVRKVLGADRRELIRQFLAESLMYSLASLLVAVVLVHLALPFVGDLLAADSVARAEGIASMSERTLAIDYIAMPWLIPVFVGLAVVVGLVSGSYPALFLASFDPSRTLKGGWVSARGNAYFRRVLVTLQFAISVALIIATGVVVGQLGHMREIRLGFDKDHVVVLPIMGMEERDSIPSIREELLRVANVKSVAASSHAPGGRPSGGSYVPEGYPEGEAEMMDRMTVDENFLETMGMEITEGRGFSPDFPADETESILINEAAANKFGWGDPIGKTIRYSGVETGKTVVGVVGDFHFSSPHRRIGPIYIDTGGARYRSVFVKIAPGDVAGTLEQLREQWGELGTGRPFEYYFLDAAYDRQFLAERNLGTLFTLFSGLAVFIACLGLFGIASFTVERRTREIGIRKVLGSSIPGLIFLLSRELIVLGVVASLVAWPVAWIFMRRWLEEFPFRIDMGPSIFILASGVMLVIGFATVSIQSIRAGLADPVETLRCE